MRTHAAARAAPDRGEGRLKDGVCTRGRRCMSIALLALARTPRRSETTKNSQTKSQGRAQLARLSLARLWLTQPPMNRVKFPT